MKELFSFCLLAFLLGTATPAIIITESLPKILQISPHKFIITIDEPEDHHHKVASPSKVQSLPNKLLQNDEESQDNLRPFAPKALENPHVSELYISQPYQPKAEPSPQFVSSPVRPEPRTSGILAISSLSESTSQKTEQVIKSSNSISNSNGSNIQSSQEGQTNSSSGKASSIPSITSSVPTSAPPTTTTSPKTPTVGLTETKPKTPMIGLANPKNL